MANLIPVSRFDDVVALEKGNPIIGARLGMSNRQAQQLLNRLTYLKNAMLQEIADNRDDIDSEIRDIHAANYLLQARINHLVTRTDVVDVVATYSDLQSYDTSSLGLNDIIKVLDDETQNGRCSYYKWSGSSFTLIGYIKSSEPIIIDTDTSDSPIGDVRYVLSDDCTLTITSGANTYAGLSLFVMSYAQNGILNINGNNVYIPQNGIIRYRYTGSAWIIESPQMLDMIYPIGSVYICGTDIDPSQFIGGTWSKVTAGYAILTAGENYTCGQTYGSDLKVYTPAGTIGNHTLTTAEVPQHQHATATGANSGSASYSHSHTYTYSQSDQIRGTSNDDYSWYDGSTKANTNQTSGNDTSHVHGFSSIICGSIGGGGAHSHSFSTSAINISLIQKSIHYYIWKRTA